MPKRNDDDNKTLASPLIMHQPLVCNRRMMDQRILVVDRTMHRSFERQEMNVLVDGRLV